MRVDEIRELVELVERSGIDELEIRRWWGGVRIVRRSHVGRAMTDASAVAPAPGEASPPTAEAQPTAAPAPAIPAGVAEGLVPIVSPMVGTFYRASSPTAPAYVEPGKRVEVGQVVCIVEAMKLMNEIESEVSGVIASILAENGQPVEFNQPLFLVKPD